MKRIKKKTMSVIEHVIDLLVAMDFDRLVGEGFMRADCVDGAKEELDNYERRLIPIPKYGWNKMDVYPRDDGGFAIDLPLWVEKEGRSDLTLQLLRRTQLTCRARLGRLFPALAAQAPQALRFRITDRT
jgi:hypothetical protein